MAAERTFWHKGLRVDVWAKSFKWSGMPFTILLGKPPDDDKIRKMIDTAQKVGNRFRPEPRGVIARFLSRWRPGYHTGGVLARIAEDAPPVPDERVQVFFDGATAKFTGPPVTREMQQLFGGYAMNGAVTGIIQLPKGLRVTYENGVTILFAPLIEAC